MADYVPLVRSNYFRVKDPEAYKAWCEGLGLTVIQNDDEDPILYGFIAEDGGVPDRRLDPETDEGEEIDFYAELAAHLADNQVAEVREIGRENMRYLVGISTAVRSDGETITVSLDEVYDRVRARWGFEMTRAEY